MTMNTKATQRVQTIESPKQLSRVSDMSEMSGFNYDKVKLEDIKETDITINAVRLVESSTGEFGLLDIVTAEGELRTLISGAQNVVRLVKVWEKSKQKQPMLASFQQVRTHAGFDVWVVS